MIFKDFKELINTLPKELDTMEVDVDVWNTFIRVEKIEYYVIENRLTIHNPRKPIEQFLKTLES